VCDGTVLEQQGGKRRTPQATPEALPGDTLRLQEALVPPPDHLLAGEGVEGGLREELRHL
jgi:hypothetical protein